MINPGDLFDFRIESASGRYIRMFVFSTKEQWGYLLYDSLDNTVILILRDSDHQPRVRKL